jgi:cytoskeletal protein CcmA (bactofilin family)
VARGISLNGALADCEHLAVEGTVEAPRFEARRLDIAEGGSFSGTAEVQQAVIAGRFDGRLTVRGRLSVKASAVIAGEIEYVALEAEPGCRIEGSLSVLARAQEAAPQPQKIAPPAPPASAKAQQGQNNVERLFADDTGEDRKVYRRAKA